MTKRRHRDVEFHTAYGKIVHTLSEAVTLAALQSLSDGEPSYIDVVVYSAAGAAWWDGGERYAENPDDSVYARIKITARDQGPVP